MGLLNISRERLHHLPGQPDPATQSKDVFSHVRMELPVLLSVPTAPLLSLGTSDCVFSTAGELPGNGISRQDL